MQQFAKSSRFVIAAEDTRGDTVVEPRSSACADRPSVAKLAPPLLLRSRPAAFAGSACTWPLPPVQLPRSAPGAGRPSRSGRQTAGSPIQDMTMAGRIIAAAAVGCAAGEERELACVVRALTSSRPEAQHPFFGSRCGASPGVCSSPEHEGITVHHLARPNNSFKLSPNGMSRWPSSAGPAAHFALAVQRAMPSVPA